MNRLSPSTDRSSSSRRRIFSLWLSSATLLDWSLRLHMEKDDRLVVSISRIIRFRNLKGTVELMSASWHICAIVSVVSWFDSNFCPGMSLVVFHRGVHDHVQTTMSCRVRHIRYRDARDRIDSDHVVHSARARQISICMFCLSRSNLLLRFTWWPHIQYQRKLPISDFQKFQYSENVLNVKI